MIGLFNRHFSLTDPTDRLGVLLILMFFAVFPIHAHSANDTNNIYIHNSFHSHDALAAKEEDERKVALGDFFKQQAIGMMPNLPDFVRDSTHWALDGLHATRGFFNLDIVPIGDEEDNAEAPANNLQSLLQAKPEIERESPLAASTSYHHRHGILPTRDAILLGAHTKQEFMDGYMHLDLHPYFGQSYFSSRHYYGAEAKLDLAKPENTAHAKKPWGFISMSYTNGDDRLMDHGRGIDMHTEIYFNDNLSLNSGIRQSDTSGAGNYVLLQWKISTQ